MDPAKPSTNERRPQVSPAVNHEGRPLRRGFTTGATATAAAASAASALFGMGFVDPVTIRLPRGGGATFRLAESSEGVGWAMAAIVKDAGDDPDVTHGALVRVTLRPGAAGAGVTFRAGEGVGTVTKPGLQLAPGEPAINPVPRAMLAEAVGAVAGAAGAAPDVAVEIAIPGGEALALKTLNGRLGIVGGLSILGTTGIVIPFSCSSWIHSIHRGIDVARAEGLEHVAACTGSTSEAAVRRLYGLPDSALIDMGDFAGGTLKYLRRHPVPRLTLAGGFGKLVKLAQGHLDLHSGRSQVDLDALAATLEGMGAPGDFVARVPEAATAAGVLAEAEALGLPLADTVAERARAVAAEAAGPGVAVELVIFDRKGEVLARAPGR
ncbi:MAG: cobalt-precorrin-5B (C(1))-methyltransferase [Geminicoccaceae bacterium]|nr:cobalt-precorrin-5B (C(1))-methyltransferase [Geminicoccaceae bacterium]